MSENLGALGLTILRIIGTASLNLIKQSIPVSNNSYTRKIIEKVGNTKNYNINNYIKNTNEPSQHKVYVSNTSNYNSSVYQDKNNNNSKINKNSVLKPYNYVQSQQKNNNVLSIQSKYFRNDNKSSALESYKLNTDNKVKTNNQIYYSSQTEKNQEKYGTNNNIKKTYSNIQHENKYKKN